MLDFWREKFVELHDGARILDIAAGNGAIATIAAEVGAEYGKHFSIAATDLAHVHAELIGEDKTREARKAIEFHSGIPCEEQPFEDDAFDMVTSQFGFEYSDIDKTLVEVRRVLTPGGRFVAISHHAESMLIEAAAVELDIYRFGMDELDLIGTSKRYFEALGELTGARTQLKRAMRNAAPQSAELNEKMNRFRKRYPEDEQARFFVGTISYIAKTARSTGFEERLKAHDAIRSDFEMHRARLRDMVEAALDQEDIDSLSLTAKDAGFQSVHCLKLFAEDNGLAGWQIHLR